MLFERRGGAGDEFCDGSITTTEWDAPGRRSKPRERVEKIQLRSARRGGKIGRGFLVRSGGSLTFGADAHTPKTAAQILCLAACEVLPAIMAALPGGGAHVHVRQPRQISNSLCSVAVPASGRTSEARPSASSNLRDI